MATRLRSFGFYHSLVVALVLPLSFIGCNSAVTQSTINHSETSRLDNSGSDFDANSWKTLIAPACQAYFDGCNNCRRQPGSDIAVCTRMACAVYQQPRCLDEAAAAPLGNTTNSSALYSSIINIGAS
jgi:hypothetical protein